MPRGSSWLSPLTLSGLSPADPVGNLPRPFASAFATCVWSFGNDSVSRLRRPLASTIRRRSPPCGFHHPKTVSTVWLPPSEDGLHRVASTIRRRLPPCGFHHPKTASTVWLPPSEDGFHRSGSRQRDRLLAPSTMTSRGQSSSARRRDRNVSARRRTAPTRRHRCRLSTVSPIRPGGGGSDAGPRIRGVTPEGVTGSPLRPVDDPFEKRGSASAEAT
jgi:hypothetical protein